MPDPDHADPADGPPTHPPTSHTTARSPSPWPAARRSCSIGRWPLADLNRATIHKITLDLSAPSPALNLYMLPEGAPFTFERAVAAVDFLIDADRYAKDDKPRTRPRALASVV